MLWGKTIHMPVPYLPVNFRMYTVKWSDQKGFRIFTIFSPIFFAIFFAFSDSVTNTDNFVVLQKSDFFTFSQKKIFVATFRYGRSIHTYRYIMHHYIGPWYHAIRLLVTNTQRLRNIYHEIRRKLIILLLRI